jgi:HD-GYP domain-containing protein (c-di-GMP phosphodiesterase class II)
MRRLSMVEGIPAEEQLEVPVGIFSHFRQSEFPVFDAGGTALRPEQLTWRDTQMVYVLVDDIPQLRDYLHKHLGALVETRSIPELHRAWALHLLLSHEIEELLYDIDQGEAPATLPATLAQLVHFQAKVHRATQALFQTMDGDEPTLALHMLHATFYSVMLAHFSGMKNSEQLLAVALGAVFADVGMAGFELEMLVDEELSLHEMAVVREHPLRSAEAMRSLGSMPHPAQQAALWHHERWDGSGYPEGIAGAALPVPARCVAIADRFALLLETNPAARRPGGAYVALKELTAEPERFDPELLRTFVKLIAQHSPNRQRRAG